MYPESEDSCHPQFWKTLSHYLFKCCFSSISFWFSYDISCSLSFYPPCLFALSYFFDLFISLLFWLSSLILPVCSLIFSNYIESRVYLTKVFNFRYSIFFQNLLKSSSEDIFFFIAFRERGRERRFRERGREGVSVRGRNPNGCFSYTPSTGMEPST